MLLLEVEETRNMFFFKSRKLKEFFARRFFFQTKRPMQILGSSTQER